MRILKIDIETAPALAYIWDLKTRYVPLKHVATDGYILCYAYKWMDEEDVWLSTRWDHGEQAMIEQAWELLDEADAVIHYNGNNFDIPRLNTEFLRYGLGPPSPAHHIDLYKAVSSNFRVLSRSMNHMLHILGMDSKIEHKGLELWTNCMSGIKEDQRLMEEYNAQDVNVLGDLYLELRPWIKNHPNVALWMEPMESAKKICPICGSSHLTFKSYKRTKVLSYKQYHCEDCGAYPRERFAEETGEQRRNDVLTW